jgi:hypothetical protein
MPLLPSATSYQASIDGLIVALHWLGEMTGIPHVSKQGYAGANTAICAQSLDSKRLWIKIKIPNTTICAMKL